MNTILKFSIVFLTIIFILVAGAKGYSTFFKNSMQPLSEPFVLTLIGGGFFGLGTFLRKLKSDLIS